MLEEMLRGPDITMGTEVTVVGRTAGIVHALVLLVFLSGVIDVIGGTSTGTVVWIILRGQITPGLGFSMPATRFLNCSLFLLSSKSHSICSDIM